MEPIDIHGRFSWGMRWFLCEWQPAELLMSGIDLQAELGCVVAVT